MNDSLTSILHIQIEIVMFDNGGVEGREGVYVCMFSVCVTCPLYDFKTHRDHLMHT